MTCPTCAEFRRGDREDLIVMGATIHACDRIVGVKPSAGCPCGCAKREPGQLDSDRLIYGNAFLGPAGERLDPRTVGPPVARPLGTSPLAALQATIRAEDASQTADRDGLTVTHEFHRHTDDAVRDMSRRLAAMDERRARELILATWPRTGQWLVEHRRALGLLFRLRILRRPNLPYRIATLTTADYERPQNAPTRRIGMATADPRNDETPATAGVPDEAAERTRTADPFITREGPVSSPVASGDTTRPDATPDPTDDDHNRQPERPQNAPTTRIPIAALVAGMEVYDDGLFARVAHVARRGREGYDVEFDHGGGCLYFPHATVEVRADDGAATSRHYDSKEKAIKKLVAMASGDWHDPARMPATPAADYGTCDWGACDLVAAEWRWSEDQGGWLPVCPGHQVVGGDGIDRDLVCAIAWCRLGGGRWRPTRDAAFHEAEALGLLSHHGTWRATPAGEGVLVALGLLEGQPAPRPVRLHVLWCHYDGRPPGFVAAFDWQLVEYLEEEYAEKRAAAEAWMRDYAPGVQFFTTVVEIDEALVPAPEATP